MAEISITEALKQVKDEQKALQQRLQATYSALRQQEAAAAAAAKERDVALGHVSTVSTLSASGQKELQNLEQGVSSKRVILCHAIEEAVARQEKRRSEAVAALQQLDTSESIATGPPNYSA